MSVATLLSCDHLAIGSGGTAGVGYVGILRAIHALAGADAYTAWLRGLRGVAGTSAGAITGLMVVLGLSHEAQDEVFRSLDPSRIFSMRSIDQCHRTYGLSDMSGVRTIVRSILSLGGLSEHATLRDLHRFTRTDFVVAVTNLSEERGEYLHHETHPTVTVIDAVCASSAIPYVFQPVRIDGVVYVDGCLTLSHPDPFPEERTAHLMLQTQKNAQTDSIFSFTSKIVSCITQERRGAVATRPGACFASRCATRPRSSSSPIRGPGAARDWCKRSIA